MPLNYMEVQSQFPKFIETHHQDFTRRESLLGAALTYLKEAAENPEQVDAILLQEKRSNPKMRCAGPSQENMSSEIALSTTASTPWLLIGVDGSQITPDPHGALAYGLINTGVFSMHTSGSEPPQQSSISKLIYQDQTSGALRLPAEEEINLIRDLEEREVLVQLTLDCEEAVIALTDGPLALFREPENNSPWSQRFETLMAQYQTLPHPNRIIAGYVDRPRSNLVIQMLELYLQHQQKNTPDQSPITLTGLQDGDLFNHILPPGGRSAVFVLHSPSANFFDDDLAIHFFYLNVGQENKPSLVRIEIPAWVAENSRLLETVQRVLLEQCQMLGNRPYPYVLHRAHEVAVVQQDEKSHLETMLMKQWLDAGFPFTEISNKQFLKNLTGSRRRIS